MHTFCATCDDSGYINVCPDEYCDCNAGVFYETRDELLAQFNAGFLDIGQDSDYEESEFYAGDMDDDDYMYWHDNICDIVCMFEVSS